MVDGVVVVFDVAADYVVVVFEVFGDLFLAVVDVGVGVGVVVEVFGECSVEPGFDDFVLPGGYVYLA